MTEFTINAEGKKLGRVASEAAGFLIGKNSVTFAKNIAPNVKVRIENTSKLDISDKKMSEKEYKFYSGYPGGLRFQKMSDAIEKKGIKEVLRKTIYGMLPTNKLRSKMIKNLVISE